MTSVKRKTFALSPIVLACALSLSGCMNDDYDSGDIDMTMGFGTDGLQLPSCSSADIPLFDILDLPDNGCVVVDSLGAFGGAAYDYWFHRSGELAEPALPYIEKIVVQEKKLTRYAEISLVPSSSAKSGVPRGAGSSITTQADIHLFEYEGDKSDDVKELHNATVESEMKFTIDPTAVSSNASAFESLTLTFPAYFTIGNVQAKRDFTVDGSKITFRDVPTSEKLVFTAEAQRFDFQSTDTEYGHLKVEGDKVLADGWVHMEIKAQNVTQAADLATKYITSSIDMSDFTITEAEGRFCPTVALSDLGSFELTGVPDFLTGDDVKMDLSNPQIVLIVESDMEVPAVVDATLVATKAGKTLATIPVDGLEIASQRKNKICICRTKNGVDASQYDQVKEVPTLSEAIMNIPDEIQFTATATADDTKTCHFVLGHYYTVSPSYEFLSPIAFAEGAQIVYNDTIDGWHADIGDMDLADESDLGVTLAASVENGVPAYLSITVTPIDENGADISSDIDVKVYVNGKENGAVKPSDGSAKVASSLSIEATQKRSGGLNKLDGLHFQAAGKASADGAEAVTGVTLNAKAHTLRINDIKVTIVGRYIGDFN